MCVCVCACAWWRNTHFADEERKAQEEAWEESDLDHVDDNEWGGHAAPPAALHGSNHGGQGVGGQGGGEGAWDSDTDWRVMYNLMADTQKAFHSACPPQPPPPPQLARARSHSSGPR